MLPLLGPCDMKEKQIQLSTTSLTNEDYNHKHIQLTPRRPGTAREPLSFFGKEELPWTLPAKPINAQS